MNPFRIEVLWLFALGMAVLPTSAGAQKVDSGRLVTLSGHAEDRLRIEQLWGVRDPAGFLLRSPSSRVAREGRVGAQWEVTYLLPEIRSVWNSELPFSMNDGSLWSGRGWSASVRLGAMLRAGRVTLIVAPEVMREQNLLFQVVPYPQKDLPHRSPWANFLHPPEQSADLPLRFGDASVTELLPGQSSLGVRLGTASVGVATENVWWGPGIRNGLVLSNQAAGFPHLFARTDQPISTGFGGVEISWILGRLDESRYFDDDPTNDHRTLSGLALTLTPAFDSGLTLGLARVVLGALPEGKHVLSALLDFGRNVGRPTTSPQDGASHEQIFSVFGRWVFPKAGFEAYAEWARFEQPASVRDLLEFPERSEGYTVGLQWVGGAPGASAVRVQAEWTNLEPDASWRFRPAFSTYTSEVVPQGFTHRGQLLGAAIGPGASSQFLAVDRLDPRGWDVGIFGGRIRPEAAAHFTDVVPQPRREDVLIFWGLRGGFDVGGWTVAAELSEGVRINYLFQTYQMDPITGQAEGVDVGNTSLSITVAPGNRR